MSEIFINSMIEVQIKEVDTNLYLLSHEGKKIEVTSSDLLPYLSWKDWIYLQAEYILFDVEKDILKLFK